MTRALKFCCVQNGQFCLLTGRFYLFSVFLSRFLSSRLSVGQCGAVPLSSCAGPAALPVCAVVRQREDELQLTNEE